MPIRTVAAVEATASLDDYSAVIDARSESEFALDRLPGAVNWPSLHDDERAAIGTEYAQVSPFAARKRGAILVARNVAEHLERHALGLPKDWRPLVYCWRGGQRSGALASVLERIGFRVDVLQGGYQAYRRAVVEALDALPRSLSFVVVCGMTGSGKSAFLRELGRRGEQVLDLEALAEHRGSVLGLAPGERQPTQKQFDSRLWDALRRFDPARPVYVESESRKIGDVRLGEALVERMRGAPCVRLELPLDARVAFLMREYDFFVRDTAAFCARLDALRALRGHETVNAWQDKARSGAVEAVVRDLLEAHYDPIYRRSMHTNYAGLGAPMAELSWDGSSESLAAAVESLPPSPARGSGPG